MPSKKKKIFTEGFYIIFLKYNYLSEPYSNVCMIEDHSVKVPPQN